MTNATTPPAIPADSLQALAGLLAQVQAQQPTPGWQQTATAAPAECLGVSVPIKVDTPAGQIRCYLNFPATAASSPAALLALLQQLHATGLPLDTWQPKESGGGWSGNSSRGGYSGRNDWRR